MSTNEELERKLRKALASDRIVMLGLDGAEQGHMRPMTAQFEHDRSPLWFFTSRRTELVKALGTGSRAAATFSAKDHSLFASIGGTLREDNDRAMIGRLWSPFVAAWYDKGKDDPDLVLLRLDATGAEVWLNEHKLMTGIKLLLGADPKKDPGDEVGRVDLR